MVEQKFHVNELYEAAYRRMRCAANACDAPEPDTPEARREIRRRLLKVLGIDMAWRPRIRIRRAEVREFVSYRLEKVRFESWDHVFGEAFLYFPRGVKKSVPGMVISHGHASRLHPGYQIMAQMLAEGGIAVALPEVFGFAERTAQGHQQAFGVFGCGTTVAGLLALEAAAWVEYLGKRPEVDGGRVGIIGNSGGGQTTALLCGLIPDEAALAVPSGFVGTFEYNAAKERRLCACSILPGVIGSLEHRHFLGCLAPKPLLVTTGESDRLCPRDNVDTAARRLRETWRRQGAGENLELFHWAGEHGWETADCFHVLRNFALRHFGLPEIPLRNVLPEPLFDVRVTPNRFAPPPAEEIPADAIGIVGLAERLTGRRAPEWSSVEAAFPDSGLPAGVNPEDFAVLSQIRAFCRSGKNEQ